MNDGLQDMWSIGQGFLEAVKKITHAHELGLKTVMDTTELEGRRPPGHKGFVYRVKIVRGDG